MGYMAKTRIRRGNRVYVYERENYRDEFGKVKHRNTRYLGVEVTIDGKTEIIPPKRRRRDFQVTNSVRYGDIAVLYTIFKEHGLITQLDELVPRRGLPVGDVLVSLAINHIIDRKSLSKFSKWYDSTALADFTRIPGAKLNPANIGAVMDTVKDIGPEGMVDVCIEIFKKIRRFETEPDTLLYDITSTYFYATTLPKARRGYNRDENNLPQINISLVVTENKGFPLFFRTYEGNIPDVKTIEQLIHDIKRVGLRIDTVILDRGMISRKNLIDLAASRLRVIGGVPLTSNEAKELVMHEITEENELIRPSGLLYYEDIPTTLFGIPGRAIVCFNHADLEKERTTRLKKIRVAERRIKELLASDIDMGSLEQEIKTAIYGVSSYFIVSREEGKITVNPHNKNRREARLRDGKYLIFTTDFEKSADKMISQYFGKDMIEKIFDCFKNWLDIHPVRHFDEGRVDVYVFVCYLAYLVLMLYRDRLDSSGWEGIKTGVEELGRIMKTTLDFWGERVDKITILTKEQKEIITRLGLERLFEGL